MLATGREIRAYVIETQFPVEQICNRTKEARRKAHFDICTPIYGHILTGGHFLRIFMD